MVVTLRHIQISVKEGSKSEYAELHYLFQVEKDQTTHTLAMISIYSNPDPNICAKSLDVLHVCDYLGDEEPHVINTSLYQRSLLCFPSLIMVSLQMN